MRCRSCRCARGRREHLAEQERRKFDTLVDVCGASVAGSSDRGTAGDIQA